MVNGNCLRIYFETQQCLVETPGMVEDYEYKSQGSQEEKYFFTSVWFECCFLWLFFGDPLDTFLEAIW